MTAGEVAVAVMSALPAAPRCRLSGNDAMLLCFMSGLGRGDGDVSSVKSANCDTSVSMSRWSPTPMLALSVASVLCPAAPTPIAPAAAACFPAEDVRAPPPLLLVTLTLT